MQGDKRGNGFSFHQIAMHFNLNNMKLKSVIVWIVKEGLHLRLCHVHTFVCICDILWRLYSSILRCITET